MHVLAGDNPSRHFVDFFFQAEDGIRDHCVTGVQTCALPIYSPHLPAGQGLRGEMGAVAIQRDDTPAPRTDEDAEGGLETGRETIALLRDHLEDRKSVV